MGYFVNIPICGNNTRVIYFPTQNGQKLEKFSLYVKDLENMEGTGNFILVPYIVGHDYVLLPAKDEGIITVELVNLNRDVLLTFLTLLIYLDLRYKCLISFHNKRDQIVFLSGCERYKRVFEITWRSQS